MNRFGMALSCGVFALLMAQGAHAAALTITIDFNSSGGFKESDGTAGTATPSGLTDAQKKAIIAVVQKEYDDALGAGKVKVSEGTGGDVPIVVQGGQAPGGLKDTQYGDAGQAGGPGVVHAGEFTHDGFSGDGLTNGIGETVAHEAGHKLGLSHNLDAPPSKMTKGTLVSKAQRESDNRKFTEGDKEILKRDPRLAAGAPPKLPKPAPGASALGVCIGLPVVQTPKADDNYLDAKVTFQAPPGTEYGYLGAGGTFAFQGSAASKPHLVTFVFSRPYVFVLRGEGGAAYAARVSLANPGERPKGVFRTATIMFRGSPARLTLTADVSRGGGFFQGLVAPPGCRGAGQIAH